MLKPKEPLKHKNVDYKITREELKQFEKFKLLTEAELDAIRDIVYQFALILLKIKKA
jgi:hypothetical protein